MVKLNINTSETIAFKSATVMILSKYTRSLRLVVNAAKEAAAPPAAATIRLVRILRKEFYWSNTIGSVVIVDQVNLIWKVENTPIHSMPF
ncbi:hypothetical protein L6452_43038 [Arctium lappa]|uniref:Uncharacterized protein n=1 Tax=Arctium lappa TaxID=4217 RepID=A0ACB8XL43_ARCLA|nr:hypothetical protein L6452_43038 [Arctium lappa]